MVKTITPAGDLLPAAAHSRGNRQILLPGGGEQHDLTTLDQALRSQGAADLLLQPVLQIFGKGNDGSDAHSIILSNSISASKLYVTFISAHYTSVAPPVRFKNLRRVMVLFHRAPRRFR